MKKPITVYSFTSLNNQLNNLKIKEQSIVRQISDAQKQGDLSENFEYHAAKRAKERIGGEIGEIAKIIASTKPTNFPENPEVVLFGSLVEIESNNSRMAYLILHDCEADPKRGSIGTGSAMFKAMFGKSPGDLFKVVTPESEREYEIISIKSAPEDYVNRMSSMVTGIWNLEASDDDDNSMADKA